MTETPVTIELPELVEMPELGDERLHIECCRITRFFCGRQYHPELSAAMETPPDEVCARCLEIDERTKCPRGLDHAHCPMPLLLGLVCPDDRT